MFEPHSAARALFEFTSAITIVFHRAAFLAHQARVTQHMISAEPTPPHVCFLERQGVGVDYLTLSGVVRPFQIEKVLGAAHNCLLRRGTLLNPVCTCAKTSSIATQ